METEPLNGLNSLLDWKPSVMDYYLRSSLTYRDKFSKRDEAPELLVCHDLRGGYLEDRWRHGTSKIDGYKFWNWWKTDLFIYFSHHFVTIPPSSWIDAAHRHGVKILGTFITEWEFGAQTCSEFLNDEKLWRKCADQLIEISSFFNFDGWLLNIENSLKPSEVSAMLQFVKYLTDGQKAKVKGSKVLWYDSVTSNGELLWQNELNSQNVSFCEACDGIFLNYAWNENSLKSTSDVCIGRSCRKERVFVGCDVFGSECRHIADYQPSREANEGGARKRADLLDTRQCFEMSRKYEMSFAIFAPSWTHEVLGAENFVENETRFWNKFDNHSKRKITIFPIVTSFCQGFGRFYCFKGTKLSTNSWSNMSLQTLQPLSCDSLASCFTDDSFVGGGCLKVSCQKLALLKLFDIDSSFALSENLTVRWFSKCQSHSRMAIIVVLDDPSKTNGTEYHHLFGRGSKPHPSDGEVVLRLLNEEQGMREVHELPPEEGLPTNDESNMPWIESCHVIHNVHGKSMKGLHLFAAEDEKASDRDITTSRDLLLGYLELFVSKEEKAPIFNTTFLESVSTCEISTHISNGVVRISVSSASEFLHSFTLVHFNKEDGNTFEIITLNDLMDAIHTNSDEPLKGPSGVYLRWRAGHGEYPCEDRAVRFHVFIGDAFETSKVFSVSPTPILELDLRHLGQVISDHVLDLSIKIECFVF